MCDRWLIYFYRGIGNRQEHNRTMKQVASDNTNNQNNQSNQTNQSSQSPEDRRKNIWKHAGSFFLLILAYIAGILYFQNRYYNLLQENPNSIIITNEAISAKQILGFISQNSNSEYNLEGMNEEVRDIISKDYSYQFTSIIHKKEASEQDGKVQYSITLPQYTEGDTCIIENIDLSLIDSGDLYINNVHAKIEPVGIEWGTFYCNRFIQNHYNKFRIVKRGSTALYKEGQSLYERETFIYLQIELFKYEEVEASKNLILILKKSDYDNLNLSEELAGSDTRINISDLEYLLSNSINYIDQSIDQVKNVQKFTPTKSDCLYFSVVSITTTGYGDILPNSSQARAIVQMEIIYGVLVMGLTLSALWAFIGSIKK